MPDTLPDQFQNSLDKLIPLAVEHGLSLLGALVILILGFWFAGKAKNMTRRALRRPLNADDMLLNFFSSMMRYLVIIVTVLAVLAQFGVETTSLIAVLGAAGLAVGLALQGTLSNVAAGVMLLVFRPFRAGHYVEIGGIAGTVKDLSLFTTELATPDNVQIIVPNSDVWGQPIKNYSFHAARRVDIVFGISYRDDIDKAMAIIRRLVEADDRCQDDPTPFVAVQDLGDSSVNLVVRVWCANADYWPVKFDLTKKVKEQFDAEGVTIPFPSRTLYQTLG